MGIFKFTITERNMKAKYYTTRTNAICQSNQQSLNNRKVQFIKENSPNEIICLVSFEKDDVQYLPFDKTELIGYEEV